MNFNGLFRFLEIREMLLGSAEFNRRPVRERSARYIEQCRMQGENLRGSFIGFTRCYSLGTAERCQKLQGLKFDFKGWIEYCSESFKSISAGEIFTIK